MNQITIDKITYPDGLKLMKNSDGDVFIYDPEMGLPYRFLTTFRCINGHEFYSENKSVPECPKCASKSISTEHVTKAEWTSNSKHPTIELTADDN